MNTQNESMLRTSYDAFGRGDINLLMSSLSDDIDWLVSGGSPLAGKYVGKNEVLSFFGKMMNLYHGRLKMDVLDILASDRHGVVLTSEAAQYDGRSVEFRSVHVWEISGGRMKRFQVFYDDAYHQFWR